jgi:hypothetical protein
MANAAPHESGTDSGAICSCPGDCAVPSIGALPSTTIGVEATIVFHDARAIHAHSSVPLDRTEFLLPFAIGPPATSG